MISRHLSQQLSLICRDLLRAISFPQHHLCRSTFLASRVLSLVISEEWQLFDFHLESFAFAFPSLQPRASKFFPSRSGHRCYDAHRIRKLHRPWWTKLFYFVGCGSWLGCDPEPWYCSCCGCCWSLESCPLDVAFARVTPGSTEIGLPLQEPLLWSTQDYILRGR